MADATLVIVREILEDPRYKSNFLTLRRADIAFLLAEVARLAEREQRIRELAKTWRQMLQNANAAGPIECDEIGHASRWEAVEMLTDQLEALIEPPVTP